MARVPYTKKSNHSYSPVDQSPHPDAICTPHTLNPSINPIIPNPLYSFPDSRAAAEAAVGPAEPHHRRQGAGGRWYPSRLQHLEGAKRSPRSTSSSTSVVTQHQAQEKEGKFTRRLAVIEGTLD